MDDRWRLNAFCRVLGPGRSGAVKQSDVLGYLESIGPGTNRRSPGQSLPSSGNQACQFSTIDPQRLRHIGKAMAQVQREQEQAQRVKE